MRKSTLVALVATVLGTSVMGNASAFTLVDDNSIATGGELGVTGWAVDGSHELSSQQWWFNSSSNTGSTGFNYELADYISDPGNSYTESLLSANQANSVFDFTATLGFTIDITYTLNGGGIGNGDSGLTEGLTITNTSGNDASFTLFQFTDFDLGNGSADDDTVIQDASFGVSQSDGATSASEVATTTGGPNESAIGDFLTLEDALFFGDTAAQATDNGDSYFGDGAWIWTYDFDFAAGESKTFTKSLSLAGVTAVPAPSIAMLLGVGLLGISAVSRRRA